MFPTEIWEEILQKITRPEDLGRLKLVCKNWNIIIENIFQNQISWGNCCSEEMRENCMFHLMNQISKKPEECTYDSVRSSDRMKYNKILREVYCHWKSWPLFFDHRVFIDRLHNNSSSMMTYKQITHFDIYRDFLGIVTDGNCILFYKLADLENIYYKVYNFGIIIQFTFWKTEKGDILALTRSMASVIQCWDVLMKTGGVNIGRGDLISIYRGECYIFYCFEITRLDYVDKIPKLIPLSNPIMSKTFMKDFVVLQVERSCNSSYNLLKLRNSETIRTSFYTIDENLTALILGPEILFLRLTLGSCEIWRIYYLFDSLRGKVKCLHYHCKLLIFGLDSGTIYIFHLKKISDLENFDFTPTNGRKIIVDIKPIIAIRVIDFQKRKTIVAATHDNVHFINFLSD